MCVDGVGVEHWSRTQKARALGSGEAEYYASVTGGAEGLGMQSLAEDLGWKVQVRIWTDSSAAKAVANRRGLGKLRYVELKWLCMQDVPASPPDIAFCDYGCRKQVEGPGVLARPQACT